MPLYEYQCAKCGKRFEKIEKLSAPRKQQCPHCGNRAERQLSAPGFQFKGSGWYVTDYSGKGKPPAGHAEGSKPEAKDGKETKETKETRETRKEPPAKETKKGKK